MGFTMVNSSMEGGLGTGTLFTHSSVAAPPSVSSLPEADSIAGQFAAAARGSRQLDSKEASPTAGASRDVTAPPRPPPRPAAPFKEVSVGGAGGALGGVGGALGVAPAGGGAGGALGGAPAGGGVGRPWTVGARPVCDGVARLLANERRGDSDFNADRARWGPSRSRPRSAGLPPSA